MPATVRKGGEGREAEWEGVEIILILEDVYIYSFGGEFGLLYSV